MFVLINFHIIQVCQQKWLRMGFEPIRAPTRDVLWHRGRGNHWESVYFSLWFAYQL